MKEKVLAILKKDKLVLNLLPEGKDLIVEGLKVAEYSVSIPVADFNRDKALFKNYVNRIIEKFKDHIKNNKKSNYTFINFKNKKLVNDLKNEGILFEIDGEILGINVLIKNKDLKVETFLNQKNSDELLAIAESSETQEETLEKLNKNKKLVKKINKNTKISKIEPEKIIIQLFSVI